MVAERTGNSFRAVGRFSHVAAGLFAAHRRLLRIVIFVGLLGLSEVQISRDRRAHAAGSHDRLQKLDDAPLIGLFELARMFELPRRRRRLRALVGRIEQRSRLIDHGDVARTQFRHARGDQMHDRSDLPGLQAPPGIELQHDGCGRLARIAQKNRRFRKRQMHPRTLHALHLDDGARQLGLQHRLIAGGLHHRTRAERGILLNHLDAHRIALRETLTRQANACLLHFGLWNRHRAGWIEFEFDPCRRECVHDLTALALRELAVKNRVVLALRPQDQPNRSSDGRRHAGEQARLFEPRYVEQTARCGGNDISHKSIL